jgi:hypothetical protein
MVRVTPNTLEVWRNTGRRAAFRSTRREHPVPPGRRARDQATMLSFALRSLAEPSEPLFQIRDEIVGAFEPDVQSK